MNKYFILCLLLSIMNSPIFCLNIYIGNLNIYRGDTNIIITEDEENATRLIYKKLLEKDYEGLLNVKYLRSNLVSKKIIKTTIEASETCDLLNIDYLLYGFMEKTNKYYNLEVRLFDNLKKDDIKIFYVKTGLDDFNEVIEELSYKFFNYMLKILGLSGSYQDDKRSFGGIGIYTGAGYWLPLSDWSNIITGIFNCELGFSVIPLSHIVKVRKFSFYIRCGFFISYSFAINKPDFLKSYFNSIMFKIPGELCFEIFSRNVFFIGLGTQLQFDILYQERLYEDSILTNSLGFGLFCYTGYEHWFGKNKIVAIGINNIFDFTFYNEIFIDYKIQIYSVVRIPIGSRRNTKRQKVQYKRNNDQYKESDLNNNKDKFEDEEDTINEEKPIINESDKNEINEDN